MIVVAHKNLKLWQNFWKGAIKVAIFFSIIILIIEGYTDFKEVVFFSLLRYNFI